ncbi:MAG: hypothetical protein AAB681_02515, partial [Patescibacteria group bacterium]
MLSSIRLPFLRTKSGGAGQPSIPSLSARIPATVTLGISTNTRLLGLAIINQGCLVDYSIHLHKSSWSPSKADKIITSLEPCVRRYCIKNIVLSIPHVHYQTKEFKTLISGIKKHFETKDLTVYTEPPETVYSFCPPEQKKTKKAMMKSLANRFPELGYSYLKELRNKKRYYIKLFEAVAVA